MSSGADADLHGPLRRYWGYDTFRPKQENVVRSILGGNDVAVVMPTGGGKSLCYQLPALVMGRTAVVISPLISLMQDQAAQLKQMGIPSAFLNSSLTSSDQSRVMREACQGVYRLLYLSPERLVREDTVAWLQRVPVAFFAIDEAHCISEWGHEFRPEYRQLSRLREHFPDLPIAAFTASATRVVRHDILSQLRLREPHKYIASFHRPNLRYLVRQCDSKSQPGLLLKAIRHHKGSNVIVYAPTVARVEQTVDFLGENGIAAVPYHGQMDSRTRQKNQERWMSDEVPVLVGTIAFGLGINKGPVRAVVHLSLPKSIEQFYQEAGRGGRDGLVSDCALLWQKKDAGLLAHFIEEIGDPGERERSWQRYNRIKSFAENSRCRHRQICLHFGETPKWESCGMCDVCEEAPAWMLETKTAAPKPKARPAEAAAGPAKRPPGTQSPSAVPGQHSELMDYLREWRREVSVRENVPAFMILPDSSLVDLCRRQPANFGQLLAVSGIGQKKAELYGAEILKAFERFRSGVRARGAAPGEQTISPADQTMQLLREGRTLQQIADIRDRRLGTVVDMVAGLVEKGRIEYQEAWVRSDAGPQIEAVIARIGQQALRTIKAELPDDITFEEIRLVLAKFRKAQPVSEA